MTVDAAFASMGCQVRLIAGEAAVADARRWLAGFDARLSRFRAASELCALNSDPRTAVPASALMRAAVRAGIWAARRSGGLVDPTLTDAVERAGYTATLAAGPRAELVEALSIPRVPRVAAPAPARAWEAIEVDDEAGVIRRPAGVRIDTGGFGKGLAADALAHRLSGEKAAVVDCGGDVRVIGTAEVGIEHPLTGAIFESAVIRDGAIATSGIGRRIWRNRDGSFAHHLIDPSSGRPAWTGVIQATAIAATALEAETLAKAALLSGPLEGRRILEHAGGALVFDDGDVDVVRARRPARGIARDLEVAA
jgi:thiamine biosynthesis lipoprotein